MCKKWYIGGVVILVLLLTASLSWAATLTRTNLHPTTTTNDAHPTLIPASITIIKPIAETIIELFTNHPTFKIEWKYAGYKDGKKLDGGFVGVYLWQNGHQVGIISNSVSIGVPAVNGDGGNASFTWDLTQTHTDIGAYQIRIQSKAYPDLAVQSAPFKVVFSGNNQANGTQGIGHPLGITGSQPQVTNNAPHMLEPAQKLASLQLTTPSGGENWQAGTKHDIAFSYANLTGMVTITAHKVNSPPYDMPLTKDLTLNGPGPDHADFLWDIPGETPGGDYQIIISSNSNPALKRVSSTFNITGIPAKITIQQPMAETQVHLFPSPSFKIEWQHEGSKNGKPLDGFVSISLFKYSGGQTGPLVKDLTKSTYIGSGDHGSFDWDLSNEDQALKEDGKYQIQIKSLSDPDIKASSPPFTIIVKKSESALTGPFTVKSPAWGENWQTGSKHSIIFNYAYYTEPVTITAHKVGGEPYDTTINDHFALNGSGNATCDWTIPAQAPAGEYQIVISLNSDPNTIKTTSNVFNIVAPIGVLGKSAISTLQTTMPAGGEKWMAGTPHDIAFSYGNMTGSVKITARRASAIPVGNPAEITIADVFPLDGSGKGLYNWIIPGGTPAGEYQIVVTSNSDPTIKSIGNPFSITEPLQVTSSTESLSFLKVTDPLGGEKWLAGTRHDIAVSYAGYSGNFKMTLRKTAGESNETVILPFIFLDGSGKFPSVAWTIPGDTPPGDYQIVVTGTSNPGIKALSKTFSINSAFQVISPAESEIWSVMKSHEISFSYSGITGSAKITIHKEGGDPYDQTVGNVVLTVGSGIAHYTGSLPHDIPGGNYRIIVTSISNPNFRGVSGVFNIQLPTLVDSEISIKSPAGGEKWKIGSTHQIIFNKFGYNGSVSMMAQRISDPPFKRDIDNIDAKTGDNHYQWTIPTDMPLGDYQILFGSSDEVAISQPFSITL